MVSFSLQNQRHLIFLGGNKPICEAQPVGIATPPESGMSLFAINSQSLGDEDQPSVLPACSQHGITRIPTEVSSHGCFISSHFKPFPLFPIPVIPFPLCHLFPWRQGSALSAPSPFSTRNYQNSNIWIVFFPTAFPTTFPGTPGPGSRAVPALTLAQGDGFPPVEVSLGVLGAGAAAVSHQAVAGVAAEAHGAAGAQPGVAQDHPVGRRLGEAAVGSWKGEQEKAKQAQGERQKGRSLPAARGYTELPQKRGIGGG